MTVTERRPHAILDRESRLLKAQKIAALVQPFHALEGARVLDIGAGSGFIANALSELVGPEGEVHAVDVLDQRLISEGYEFQRVDCTTLPFESGTFDVVLSNHVIEHVGIRPVQRHHLREIRRVLAPGGVAYLAVPNRWVLVEPHFKLPFLSWLPQRLRSPYVRLARRGDAYDCDLPTRGDLNELFAASGLDATELTVEATRVVARVEEPSGPIRLLLGAPEPLLRLLLPVTPTMIFALRPSA
jgi:SAM-dependent methyltransferase